MEKLKLIMDCDCTMGVPGCDADDGLALLYVLGCPEAELLGVTCSFGNNRQDTVYENTKRLLREWGRIYPCFGARTARRSGVARRRSF